MRHWRKMTWVPAALALCFASLAGCGESEKSKPASPATEARSYIKAHDQDATRVHEMLRLVLASIVRAEKSGTAADRDEVAELAQKAHDRIDEVRKSFGSGYGTKYGAKLSTAADEVATGADGLKNAMGALVAYYGTPNPATRAHFRAQYGPAVAGWNEGIKTIWQFAHTANPPTV